MTVFTNQGGGKQQVVVRGAVSRQDPRDGSEAARRRADLPEGLVPVRRARHLDRHRVSAADRRRPVRRRRVHHAAARRRRPRASCTPAARCIRSSSAPGRRCASTPAVSSRCSRRSSYDIQFVGKIKTALFGGEGLFFATLTGPGRVWLQSLPFSRMADRIYKAAPAAGGARREEGSILGGLGGLLDGDQLRMRASRRTQTSQEHRQRPQACSQRGARAARASGADLARVQRADHASVHALRSPASCCAVHADPPMPCELQNRIIRLEMQVRLARLGRERDRRDLARLSLRSSRAPSLPHRTPRRCHHRAAGDWQGDHLR